MDQLGARRGTWDELRDLLTADLPSVDTVTCPPEMTVPALTHPPRL
jgi:hypothetical protein